MTKRIDDKAWYQPWYHKDFNSDPMVRNMTPRQRSMYMNLCHEAWECSTRPRLPLNSKTEPLWALAGWGLDAWEEEREMILLMFTTTEDGLCLERKRLNDDWEALQEERRKASEKAKKGNEARWHSDRQFSSMDSQTIAQGSSSDRPAIPNDPPVSQVSKERKKERKSEERTKEGSPPSLSSQEIERVPLWESWDEVLVHDRTGKDISVNQIRRAIYFYDHPDCKDKWYQKKGWSRDLVIRKIEKMLDDMPIDYDPAKHPRVKPAKPPKVERPKGDPDCTECLGDGYLLNGAQMVVCVCKTKNNETSQHLNATP